MENKELQMLSTMCESYMNEADNAPSVHDIVDYAVKVLEDCGVADAEEYYLRACVITNLWCGDTLEDVCDEASLYVEELCGFLAEILA